MKTKPQRVTIKDVARVAGVSVTTISNYLNGRFGNMTEATRERIRVAIEKTNYVPSAAGQSLRTRRNRLVTMAFQREEAGFLSDPFLGQTVEGLSRQLTTYGYGLVVSCVGDDDREDFLNHRARQSDCVCILRSGESDASLSLSNKLSALGVPVVFLHQTAPEGLQDVASVMQDDFAGAETIAQRILKTNPRRVLILTHEIPWPQIERRVSGFVAAIERSPQVALEQAYCDEFSLDGILSVLDDSAEGGSGPDAIICSNDQIAHSAYVWAIRRGLSVPQDVQITGFNALSYVAPHVVTLTSVRSRPFDVGIECGKLVHQRIEFGSFEARSNVLPLEIRHGETTT